MSEKTLPPSNDAQTKESGYYDTADLPNGLKGPAQGAVAATAAAVEANVEVGNICVFRWDDRNAIAVQLGIDPPA